METRRLGRTGHHSSVAILGGAAFARATSAEARAGLELALTRGVNHLDIAPRYGDAEIVVGDHLRDFREHFFVAGKSTRANPDGIREQLETTLTRLGTDTLDLYQMHAVTTMDELERRIPALEFMLAAREIGLVRHVGITGHDLTVPATHLAAVMQYDLDTVMFPVYPGVWSIPEYRRDAEALLEVCAERDIGVMAIKAVARRPWGTTKPSHTTWYEPYTDAEAMARGIDFALSTPGVHAFCTPGDLGLLPEVLTAAEAVTPMAGPQREWAMELGSQDEIIFPIDEKAVGR